MPNWRAVREKIEAQPGLCCGAYYADGACCAVGALVEGSLAERLNARPFDNIAYVLTRNEGVLEKFFKVNYDLSPSELMALQETNDREMASVAPHVRRAKVIEWLHTKEAEHG